MTQQCRIHELEIGNTKVFFIEGEKNILVDTGSAPASDVLFEFLLQSGITFKSEEEKKEIKEGAFSKIIHFLDKEKLEIDAIICTHWHGDHTGNLKKLKDALGVPVAMHPDDIAYVEGTEEPPHPSFVPEEIREHLDIEPCKVDIQLKDGEFFSKDVQVIHVKGHTNGSICLLVRNKTLLAGDCVVGKNETNPMMGPLEINPPIQMFSADYPQALTSLQKLLTYDFTAILPTHGASVAENGKEKFEKLLRVIEEDTTQS